MSPGLRLVQTAPTHDWNDVQRGEPTALEALLEQWLPVVLQWCRRLGGPRVDPDQAAQEIAIVVLRRIHTVRAAEAFPSWLFAVTRRVLAQHRRRHWGIRWNASATVDRVAAESTPESHTQRQEEIAAVRAVIQRMPHTLREVLVLADVEERSQPEVAELLGLPLGTVKSRLRRARHTFARQARADGLRPSAANEQRGGDR